MFGVQNSLKFQRGRLSGLRDPILMGKKEAAKARLRAELASNAAKQQELGGSWNAIEKTPAVARSLDADAQTIAKRYEDEVTAIQQAEYPRIGQAVFVVDGAKAYPDATGTLRLSFGAVKSYMEAGKKIPAYTDFASLYEDSVNRCVSVDSRAIIEALRKIYKADALADEMMGKAR